MKQRFSSLDIRVIAHELSLSLVSLRVSSIYDLSSRIFLFKFAKPEHREQLVVDSGFRCHLTGYGRTIAGEPSAFVARLRKFLKTRRVTSVAQVGTDRILEIQFSDGQFRLFLEFYAGGNIVLTDKELKIISLLRNVTDGAPHENIRQGSDYNLSLRQNVDGIPMQTPERVKDGLRKWVETQGAVSQPTSKKKHKTKAGDELRKALTGCINEYPPMLLDHAMHIAGLDSSQSPQHVLQGDTQIQLIMASLEVAGKVMDHILGSNPVKGYIFGKSRAVAGDSEAGADPKHNASSFMYHDFQPFMPIQLSEDPLTTVLEFDGFNKAVDEFFSSIEGQKLESRLQEREAAARKKLESARQNQEERIDGLQAVQELNVRKAQAVEANLERVEEAIAAINGLIGQGIDWIEIDRLIELEQARNNPIASVIRLPLNLHENTATMLLGEWMVDNEGEEGNQTGSEPAESDDEDEHRQDTRPKTADIRLKIDINLALSAWANARQYYGQKKTAASKQEKTVQASVKALKSAQTKIEADLKRGLKQEKAVLRPVRKQFWFEKFIYFVSSDGYLVIGAKDAQQAEIIYKRHLKKSDIWVHADLAGAAPVLIKNNPATPDAPIPPSTLSQAGNMSVITSTAWDSKAVMSAWWIPGDKVSKFTPQGDFLPPGFMHIMGEKQYLAPAQLLLGFGVMFYISNESKTKHLKHRVPLSYDTEVAKAAAVEAEARQLSQEGENAEVDNDAASATVSEDDDGDENIESYKIEQEGEDAEQDLVHRRNSLQTHFFQPLAGNGKLLATLADEEAQISTPERDAPTDPEYDEDADGEEKETDKDERTTDVPSNITGPSLQQNTNSPIPVRGKRGKRKKIAQRYRDQDEEDRADALRLLGSKIGQEKAEQEARAEKAKEEMAQMQRLRRREQHEKAQREGRQRELQRLAEEEHASVNDDEDGLAVTVDLDTLVGTPLVGDEILEAIPVCAPWSSLQKYKYKVKLQPGSQKKGKAVREILGGWANAASRGRNVDEKAEDVERIWPRETELIKAWKDTEVFNILPVSKVRVALSGSGASKDGKGGQVKGKARGGKGSKRL